MNKKETIANLQKDADFISLHLSKLENRLVEAQLKPNHYIVAINEVRFIVNNNGIADVGGSADAHLFTHKDAQDIVVKPIFKDKQGNKLASEKIINGVEFFENEIKHTKALVERYQSVINELIKQNNEQTN